MNLKTLTKETKIDLFKRLVQDLDLEALKEEAPNFELSPISESIEPAKDRLNHPDQIEGISTGYRRLDDLIGGIVEEELIIVSGGTGTGKTQFTQGIILNMALNGVPVLFFTLEMPPVETTIRFIKMIRSLDAGEVLPELPIYYYHGDNASLIILEEAIKKGVTMGIKCIVVDHLHFFAKTSVNQAAEIGNIAREIKLMARRYHVPIILIAHVRKTGSPSRVPGLEDIKDSSGIAQDADMVLMLWRNMETNEETAKRTLKLKVRKNRRMGVLGSCQYKLDINNYLQEMDYVEELDEI